jgi:2-amino-4-hydroxy-6-hydroxymethyldihydropteridine diphosphokinase
VGATGDRGDQGARAIGRGAGESWVVVALGSNLGASARCMRAAMDRLEALAAGPMPMLRSSLWRTAPVDCPPGSADFLNAVVAWVPPPGQTPEALLVSLQGLEREYGRRPKEVHNEARPLDLDLIAFGDARRHTERLCLPHPRAAERAFVLYPLAEILPDWVMPGQARSVRELRDGLGDAGRLRCDSRLGERSWSRPRPR